MRPNRGERQATILAPAEKPVARLPDKLPRCGPAAATGSPARAAFARAKGTGSKTDGSTGRRFGVKSASAAWRELVIRSRSSPRVWCCCCRWLSKGCPDCLGAPDIEVEFVNFGKVLTDLLGWPVTRQKSGKVSSGKSARRTHLEQTAACFSLIPEVLCAAFPILHEIKILSSICLLMHRWMNS